MKKISVWLDDEAHRRLKLHCAGNGTFIQGFVSEAISSALTPVAAAEPLHTIRLPLSKRDKNRYVRMAGDILRSGDPLAINFFKATVAFYSAKLTPTGNQPSA